MVERGVFTEHCRIAVIIGVVAVAIVVDADLR